MKKLLLILTILSSGALIASEKSKAPSKSSASLPLPPLPPAPKAAVKASIPAVDAVKAEKKFVSIETSIQELSDALIAWYISNGFNENQSKEFGRYLVTLSRETGLFILGDIERFQNKFNNEFLKNSDYYSGEFEEFKETNYIARAVQKRRGADYLLSRNVNGPLYCLQSQKKVEFLDQINKIFQNNLSTIPREYRNFVGSEGIRRLQQFMLDEERGPKAPGAPGGI